MEPQYYVYIFTDGRCISLSIGMTDNILLQIQRLNCLAPRRLVYYETYTEQCDARWREQCLKDWRREWKKELIEQENPEWRDLSDGL